MSIAMPETPHEMLQLPGVTKANFDKYGTKLLEITVKYSAEKYSMLLEHQDAIEDFDAEPVPGPSTSRKASSKQTAFDYGANNRKKATSSSQSQADDGWISVNSQESKYFNSTASKKSAGTKRKSANYSVKKPAKGRKSFAAKAKAKYSPKKTTTGRKPAAASRSISNAKSKPASSGFIGFMPMPVPK